MFSSYKAPFHLSCCSQWYWMLKSGMCIEHSDVYHQMNSVLFQLVRHHLKCMVPAPLLTGSHHCFQCLGCSRSLDMQSMPWQPGERGYIKSWKTSAYTFTKAVLTVTLLCVTWSPHLHWYFPLVQMPLTGEHLWRSCTMYGLVWLLFAYWTKSTSDFVSVHRQNNCMPVAILQYKLHFAMPRGVIPLLQCELFHYHSA